MNSKDIAKAVKDSQSLPVATLDDVWGYQYLPTRLQEIKTEDEMNEYLSSFVKPSKRCWCCKNLMILDWTVVRGLAQCHFCGIEVRNYHYFETGNKGEKDVRWISCLQYHPKNYSPRPPE